MKTIEQMVASFQKLFSSKEAMEHFDERQKKAVDYIKKHEVAPNNQWKEKEIKVFPHPYYPHQKDYIYFHRHHCFELVYIYQGTATNYFANSKLVLNKGDALLLNPNIGHHLCVNSIDDVVFNIQITKEAFDQSFLQLLSDNKLFSDFFMDYLYQINQLNDFMYCPYDPENDIAIPIKGVVEEFFNDQIGHETMIKFYLAIAFRKIARSYFTKMELQQSSQEHQKKIFSILSYLNQHYHTATLPEVAEQFHYSEKYLSRLIKKATGKTFNEIIITNKLNEAQELLSNSSLSVEEIAVKVGYLNPAPFYKLFKERYGVTPAHFRKEQQQKNNIPLQ